VNLRVVALGLVASFACAAPVHAKQPQQLLVWINGDKG
jgi:hypothetical protein